MITLIAIRKRIVSCFFLTPSLSPALTAPLPFVLLNLPSGYSDTDI